MFSLLKNFEDFNNKMYLRPKSAVDKIKDNS